MADDARTRRRGVAMAGSTVRLSDADVAAIVARRQRRELADVYADMDALLVDRGTLLQLEKNLRFTADQFAEELNQANERLEAAEADRAALLAERDQLRRIWQTDLQMASDRVLTLELDVQHFQAERDALRARVQKLEQRCEGS